MRPEQQAEATTADVQLLEDDSLQVATSDWSQTKSARRRQRRKDHHNKQSFAEVADPSAAQAIELIDPPPATQQGADIAVQPDRIASAGRAASSASKLLSLPRGKRAGARPFSPPGRKKFGSRNKRDGAVIQLSLEDVQLQQQNRQEDAELQNRVRTSAEQCCSKQPFGPCTTLLQPALIALPHLWPPLLCLASRMEPAWYLPWLFCSSQMLWVFVSCSLADMVSDENIYNLSTLTGQRCCERCACSQRSFVFASCSLAGMVCEMSVYQMLPGHRRGML